MVRFVRLSLAAFCLAGALHSQEAHVHTSRDGARLLPLPKGDDVWHFIIYGDRTGGNPAGLVHLRQAVVDTNLLDPDLVMTVGDLVQGYNAEAEWLAQAAEYKGIMNGLKRPWYPVPGNHDVYWRGADRPPNEHEGHYETHFGPLWYWFEHKNAAFIVLYSDEGDPETGEKGFGRANTDKFSDRQLAWLTESLERTKKYRHVFVFLHHPRWITADYPHSNWERVHERLVAAGNVKVVFAGHIHQMRYDGKKDGIEYFTLAATGASIRMDVPLAGYLHEFNVVTVRDEGYSIAALPVGAAMDPRQFTPERIAEIDAVSGRITIPATVKPIVIDAGTPSLLGLYRVRVTNPAKNRLEATFSMRAPDAGWTFLPDHRHMVLEPGVDIEVEFAYSHAGPLQTKGFKVPQLGMQLDWLGPDVRISLPERLFPATCTLTGHEALPALDGVSLLLDGKGDCVRVPNETLAVPDGPFTVEAWMRAESVTGRRPLVSKAESSEFSLFFSDGKAHFSVHLAGAYVTAEAPQAVVAPGVWHHVAGEFDGETVRIYVDGKLAAQKAGKGKRKKNDLPLFVGADTDGNGRPADFMKGQIDDLRVSTGARYGGREFKPERRLARNDDTVLLLRFDRDFGPLTPDDSGRATHGQRVGGAHCAKEPVAK